MSIRESYKTINPKPHIFFFKSVGKKGEIIKIILFQKTGETKFNLAFGDYVNNDLDDEIVSNNDDLRKVISTVVSAVYDFLNEHPNTVIEIKGVDEKRTRLYNHIFRRRWNEIKGNFVVRGFLNNEWELYQPTQSYSRFEIESKN